MAFSMPSTPAMPAMPDMPAMPAMPAMPGGGVKIDIDDLMQKLDAAEKKIYGCVESAIPKVNIVLPLLPNPDAAPVNPTGKDEQLPLLSRDSNGLPQDMPREETMGAAAKDAAGAIAEKEAEFQNKAEAAKAEAEKAAAEMEAKALKMAQEAEEQMRTQFVAPAIAAVTSTAIALTLAYATVLHAVAPWLNGALGALINSMGFAKLWQTRADSIFDLVNGVFESSKEKVAEILETVEDVIMGPVNKLFGAIDGLIEEQKAALDKAKQLETTLKVDIPDADDLKKPLDGCKSKVTATIDMVKKEIPTKMIQMVQSTFEGQVATQKSSWNMYVVYLPVAIITILNVSIAMVTVYLSLPPAAGESQLRQLRGSHHNISSSELDVLLPPGLVPPGLPSSQEQIIAYLKPTVLQIVLAVVQSLVAIILSQKPRIIGYVNTGIKSLSDRVNDDINGMIKETVDNTIGIAFKAVKDQADKFFPKIKEVMEKMKPILKMMG